ncbi:hypothetical protein [Treponema sp.]|uniref:hypothetical protein n=1 Tax=Treponema sp. TaxID=166 RepID=UPI003F09707E
MYSNCLIEAVKAKIKDPKNVQIIRLPKELNSGKTHFMWIKNDYVYHAFKKNTKESDFWFEYKIKKVPITIFQRWMLGQITSSKNLKEYANKFNLPLNGLKGIHSYEFLSTDEKCLFYEENFDWSEVEAVYDEVKKVMKKEPQIKLIDLGTKTMSIVSFEELKQYKGNFRYKFLTPYDEDFESMYLFSANLEKSNILETYED